GGRSTCLEVGAGAAAAGGAAPPEGALPEDCAAASKPARLKSATPATLSRNICPSMATSPLKSALPRLTDVRAMLSSAGLSPIADDRNKSGHDKKRKLRDAC